MKPGVKKWLKVVGVVYAVVVIAMVAAMWTKAKPADPKGLALAVRQSLEQVRTAAVEGDPEHIRANPIAETEAAAIVDAHLLKRGAVIGINYTLIMQCLNFGVLMLFLYGLAWGPLLEFLDKRRAIIKERLDAAAQNRREAEGVLLERRQELAGLRQERAGILEQAKGLAEQERDQIVERARLEAERLMEQTEERLGEEARRARVALREEVADLAVEIAARVLGREIARKDHDAVIAQVADGMALDPEDPSGGETA